jgi:adenylate cyclase
VANKAVRAVIVGGAAALVGVLLLLSDVLGTIENTTWDVRVRALARPSSATDEIALVLVDQADLDEMREVNGIDWPWPRSLYGYMIDFAAEAGAASFSVDLVLEDSGAGVSDNQVMLAAAGRYGRTVYGTELLGEWSNEAERWPDGVPRPELAVNGLSEIERAMITFPEATFPRESVIPSNADLSFFNQKNDEDGVFRRYRLVNYLGDQPMLALGLAPALLDAPRPLEIIFSARSVVVGDLEIPVDRDGRVILNYTTPERVDPESGEILPPHHTAFSAFDMAVSGFNLSVGGEPLIDPDELSGKHLLLGVTGSGLRDLRPTPVEELAAGVTGHATMLDNVLSGSFMRDTPLWFSALLIVALAVGFAFLATYASKSWVELLIFLFGVVVAVGLGFAAYPLGYWFPIAAPLAAVLLSIAAANVVNYATEGAQKRFIRGAFGQYLSPDVVNQVVDNPDRLRLGGERRELTMFFSDIQGFTTISEALDPEQLSAFLNVYLTEMGRIIHDEGGTIDKFEGDAIIAFWNAPLEVENHPERAVRTALRCQTRLAELRDRWNAPPPDGVGVPILTRIGLNTGEVSVGNFGSESRFDYTALGDHMNLASRLEGSNKMFGTYVLVSEFTMRRLSDVFAGRELGRIAVVGRAEPIAVFEPMFREQYAERAQVLDAYATGLQAWYRGELDAANEAFAAIATQDEPAKRMLAQIELIRGAGTRVTQGSWDGVVRLTEK